MANPGAAVNLHKTFWKSATGGGGEAVEVCIRLMVYHHNCTDMDLTNLDLMDCGVSHCQGDSIRWNLPDFGASGAIRTSSITHRHPLSLTHTSSHTQTHTHPHTHILSHTHAHILTHTHIHAHILSHILSHTHLSLSFKQTHAHTHARTHARTYTYHTRMHTHTHTHTDL